MLRRKFGQQHFESAMDDVVSAKAIMQQSLFTGATTAPDVIAAVQNETQWNTPAVVALVLASVALLASFLAVALVYLR